MPIERDKAVKKEGLVNSEITMAESALVETRELISTLEQELACVLRPYNGTKDECEKEEIAECELQGRIRKLKNEVETVRNGLQALCSRLEI